MGRDENLGFRTALLSSKPFFSNLSFHHSWDIDIKVKYILTRQKNTIIQVILMILGVNNNLDKQTSYEQMVKFIHATQFT